MTNASRNWNNALPTWRARSVTSTAAWAPTPPTPLPRPPPTRRAHPNPSPSSPLARSPVDSPDTRPCLRQRLPPERVHQAVAFVPDALRPLPRAAAGLCPGPDDPEPDLASGRRVAHPGRRGHRVSGPLPHLPLLWPHSTTLPSRKTSRPTASARGWPPRWCYLAGSHHVSSRGLEEIAEDVFEVPLAAGDCGPPAQQQMSGGLGPGPRRGRPASSGPPPVKNVDETSWKLAGQLCWLWVAATQTVAAFLIHARRGGSGLAALLGEQVQGFVCSDRWSA